jgi:hypothetical protein
LREAEYAMGRRGASPGRVPDITPIILEGPPIPSPPPSLASLHFNDMLRYIIMATEVERQNLLPKGPAPPPSPDSP